MNRIYIVAKKAICNPALLFSHLCQYWPFRLISDKQFLKLFFYAHQKKKVNLANPTTFNEKLQWLKLNDRKDEYTILTDKYEVKKIVANIIGEEYIIPTIMAWDSVKEINFDKLPERFVLKCNHDSGSVVICTDKSSFDRRKAIKKLKKAMKRNYFWTSREYNYKNINRKIIAEEFISDDNSQELTDYKFFCFNGVVKFIQVDRNRFTNHIRNFYSKNWDFIDVEYGCKNDKKLKIKKPEKFEEMINLAEILSKNIPHVRVDFYYTNNRIYFGELTFHHGGGVMQIKPIKFDKLWGDFLELPINK